jgi:hypothetical protein
MKRSTVPPPVPVSAGGAAGLRPDREKSTTRRQRASVVTPWQPWLREAFATNALLCVSRRVLERTLDFLQAGIEAHEPILVVLNRDKTDALRSELGPRARDVAWADMADVGSNPPRGSSRPGASL